jgi:hypothetical protein
MNEFTAKNEQAFLDACGAIGVEPNAMIEPHKERYLVSEFLKDPVSWLETERLYYSYTTPGEAQSQGGHVKRQELAAARVLRRRSSGRPIAAGPSLPIGIWLWQMFSGEYEQAMRSFPVR